MNSIFARLVKVNEEKRLVTGRATREAVDRENECLSYSTSKPEFMKWSAEAYAATEGKSRGNVRAMHGGVAAGVLTNIDFNDVERAIDVEAHITDDQEWRKVLSGTYSGFSIGGRYSKKWTEIVNGKTVTMYTAVPSEISLVDRPCLGDATFDSISKTFDLIKGDGSVQKRQFSVIANKANDISNEEFHRFLQNFGPAFLAVRKANASRPQPLSKLFAGKRPLPRPLTDVTAIEIKKAHSAAGRVQVDVKALNKMLKRGRLHKLALPEQSSNGRNDRVTANTGASNNFRDQTPDGQITSRMGGQSIIGIPLSAFVNSRNTTPTPNSPLLLDAIKRDLSRPRQW